ncbi:glutamate 5-kinase [Bifidobacterium jacchi]|uniref:Glutamate 5-kinase n=1 Tax=Bifidobacterium jacchi TaxID=2490545 RepID=A0A5N5RIF7_9BIFI|nr:glutamate 5-kinase [Bifidobacterium jacchi]KAB5607068.1 glutamate 5-kinase [Bifidobacterium jacchi]
MAAAETEETWQTEEIRETGDAHTKSAQAEAAQPEAAQAAQSKPAAASLTASLAASLTETDVRRAVAGARTVVVKVGSSSLTKPSGHLDGGRLDALVSALATAAGEGARVVLVSSGAIAAGFGPLGFDARPLDVATQQAAASVGQGLLMARYESSFARFGVRVGQILITAEDTIRAAQYRNVQRTLGRLLDLGVVPIVNENDSLASNEIRFGDNDRLSALVANIVRADALVLLTDVDALYTAPPSQPGARRVGFVPDVVAALGDVTVTGPTSGVGTGGMVTKLEAARVAAVSGIPTVLTSAVNAGPALMGDPVGTAFAPVKHRGSSRRLWIGFAAAPRGTLVADEGAARAVRGGRASLLAAGVVEVRGEFSAGDPVWIDDESGAHVARGLSGFDSEEIPQMLGRTSAQLRRFLGEEYAHPLVHRDNLVLV